MQRYFLNTDPDSCEVHLHRGCNMMSINARNAKDLGLWPSIDLAVCFAKGRCRDANPCGRCEYIEKVALLST